MAAVHGLCTGGGLVQLQHMRLHGLRPSNDFQLKYCQSAPEAVKMLVSGWADAAFVPEGSEKRIWPNEQLATSLQSHLVELERVGPIPANVFLFRKDLMENSPTLCYQLAESLIAYYGQERLVRTRRSYYVSLKGMVSGLNE